MARQSEVAMKKYADRYLSVEPWSLTEVGFHSEQARVTESLMSQANEAQGVRASFEEGYSGDSLPGAYVGGIYEERIGNQGYKGVSNRLCFMVNGVDWSHLRLDAGSERLDLAKVSFDDFTRSLDFKTGLLVRTLTWNLVGGSLALRFERLLSMDHPDLAFHRLTVTSHGWTGPLTLRSGLDFGLPHEVYKENYWTCGPVQALPLGAGILGATRSTKQRCYAAFHLRVPGRQPEGLPLADAKFAGVQVTFSLKAGETLVVEKDVIVAKPATESLDDTAFARSVLDRLARPVYTDFNAALAANKAYWAGVWDKADIAIEGDPDNQQGIRFSIFQLEQTFRGKVPGANIGAKGLSGEFYNGNYFWDSEVYCLPYYLFKNPAAARSLLEFRYNTLPQALERARDLDCRGACFPVATIDGTESCTLWQHASLQFQPTTGVAYALRHYWKATGDDQFMAEKGLELFVQMSRFLASRCQYSPRKKAWGYYAVMGPDEFQMMVNHNAYTNFMGARSLEAALEALAWAKTNAPADLQRVMEKVGLTGDETALWKEIAANMYLPIDAATGVFEQHEGFFDLPHVDIKAIPAEEFPLYHHWSYDRIYRNDMIKQPDVLLFLFLYNRSFTAKQKLVNYDYYEPRTIHESSLSPSVHSILATELGKHKEALDFFRFATRIDLDNYNRNTREGLHLTAIAGAWMNIVYGFGGFRSDGEVPALAPVLPPNWKGYTFNLLYRNSLIGVRVDGLGTTLTLREGPPVDLDLKGTLVTLTRVGETLRFDTQGVKR
jgi:maltose phosphorylase